MFKLSNQNVTKGAFNKQRFARRKRIKRLCSFPLLSLPSAPTPRIQMLCKNYNFTAESMKFYTHPPFPFPVI